MSDPAWLNKYVGVPFKDKGMPSLKGFNCIGLVHLVFKDAAKIEISPYTDISAEEIERANAQFDIETTSGVTWVSVEKPLQMFDVVLLRGVPLHVGVLVDPNRVLHVWRATDSVVMPLDHYHFRGNKIMGFYRHRSLL